jgi:leucyl aminopeptidase
VKKAVLPIFASTIDSKLLESWNSLDAIAVGVKSSEEGPLAIQNPVSKSVASRLDVDFAAELALWPEFTGKAGEIIELPVGAADGIERLYLVGVGSQSREDYRKAGATLGRKTKGTGFHVLNGVVNDSKHTGAHLLAIALSQYVWNLKSETKKKSACTFITFGKFDEELSALQVRMEAIYTARDLIHTPSNIKNPAWLATQAKSLASKKKDLTVKVRAGRELAKFGGVRAVGGSSPQPGPRVIEITYAPRGSTNWPHVVLVGKGITFDTGGISLKRPYDIMMAMKSDMAGAAAVLATVLAMPDIQPKVRVTALMMCAENALSGTSQRPSDVITQYDGTTVEVLDTDAEGRLVLADGLAYARNELQPDYLVDIATLTGAATIGLGKQFAAMYTRNERLARKLHEIGNTSGDRVWHMPLVDDYAIGLESDIADLSHIEHRGHFQGGSITAALFLEKFAGKTNWVHLDIAGTGRSDVDAGEFVKGGTGFGPRLLLDWIESL